MRAQWFLSGVAFSIYEVVQVACLSRSWFIYAPIVVGTTLTEDVAEISTWLIPIFSRLYNLKKDDKLKYYPGS